MNTVNKIQIRENKTLKLNKVLIRKVSKFEIEDIDKISYIMQGYIKSKGNSTIGPRIISSNISINEYGEREDNINLIFQLKDKVECDNKTYKYKDQIKVSNCLFARFSENEENLYLAYNKLEVYAFENNIKLGDNLYTVRVIENENKIVADIFIETMKGGSFIEHI